MRTDMKDIIINTGRHGGGGKNQYGRAYLHSADPEDLPSRLPMGRRRQYGYDCKEPGDRTAPLIAYLESQVGRRWDDIWSEICAHADSRNIRGYHLRQHVKFAVELHPETRRWGRYEGLYVDSEGILRNGRRPTRTEIRRRWRDFKPTTRLGTENPDFWYEKVDGFWYSFETVHIRDDYSTEYLEMVDGEVKILRTPPQEHWRHETTKRQVDSKTSDWLDGEADKIDRKRLLEIYGISG